MRVASNPERAIACISCNALDTKICKGKCNTCYNRDRRRALGAKPFKVGMNKEEKNLRAKELANHKKRYVRESSRSDYKEKRRLNYERNKASYVRRAHNRYLQRKEQTLPTVVYSELQSLYDTAKEMSVLHGIKYNVDHIVPLKHKNVCGLNVPWNLQILTEFENKTKSNKFDGTCDNKGWKDEL